MCFQKDLFEEADGRERSNSIVLLRNVPSSTEINNFEQALNKQFRFFSEPEAIEN